MNLGDWKIDHRIVSLYLELELRKMYGYVDVDTVATPNDRSTVAKYIIHYGEDEATCMHAEMAFYNKALPVAMRYRITIGNEQMDEQYHIYMKKDELADKIVMMLAFFDSFKSKEAK